MVTAEEILAVLGPRVHASRRADGRGTRRPRSSTCSTGPQRAAWAEPAAAVGDHRVGHPAVLPRLRPAAADRRRPAAHLPVRAGRDRPARAAARRRDRRRARRADRAPRSPASRPGTASARPASSSRPARCPPSAADPLPAAQPRAARGRAGSRGGPGSRRGDRRARRRPASASAAGRVVQPRVAPARSTSPRRGNPWPSTASHPAVDAARRCLGHPGTVQAGPVP